MWGYWAGTWGSPGQRPWTYINNDSPIQADGHSSAQSWSLHAFPNGTLKWGFAAWDMYGTRELHLLQFHAASRSESGLMAPEEALIGICASPESFENCTYMGEDGDLLTLMPAERAQTFKWSCNECASRPPNGEMVAVVALIVLLALLPLPLYCVWRSRRKPPTPTQWPAAPRSELAWIVCFISWALVLVGMTPSVLWYVGRWWANGASMYVVLSVLGTAGMQLCLRSDDPLTLIRLVSVCNVIARIAIAWFSLKEAEIMYSRIFDTSSHGFPSSTTFGRLAVDGVNLLGLIASTLLIIVFCISQAPLWCPGIKRGQRQPLRWLWGTMRFNCFATAILLFSCSLASLLIGFTDATEKYPAEVQRGAKTLVQQIVVGTGLLIVVLITGENARLSIHLANIRKWQRTAFIHVTSSMPSAERAASQYRATSTAFTKEDPPNAPDAPSDSSVTRGHSSPTATCSSQPPSAAASSHPASLRFGRGAALVGAPPAADAPPGMPNLGLNLEEAAAHIAMLWSDVDVSTWREPDGRFDALQVLSCIGYGGQAVVFMGEVDKPLTLGSGAAVEGRKDAASPSDDPKPTTAEASTTPSAVDFAPWGLHAHSTPTRVAVKIFDRRAYKDVAEVRRLQRELDLAPSFSHPHVVRTFGTTLLSGRTPALVMELMAGSLTDLLWPNRRGGRPGGASDADAAPPLSAARTLTGTLKRRLLLEVAIGLEFLHSQGVVHRDIKPANVLLDGELHAKIGDFGIATRFGMETLTADVGTARYMAPEVIFGPYDYRADIFAFGVLTWETLHEAVAFGSETYPLAALLKLQRGVRPPIDLPEDLVNLVPLIETCWQEQPIKRPQRMTAVVEILEGCGAAVLSAMV